MSTSTSTEVLASGGVVLAGVTLSHGDVTGDAVAYAILSAAEAAG